MSEHQEWRISEVPFTSKARHVGSLIVRLRTAWNGIATRWYVLPIVQQINVTFGEIRRRLSDVSQWITDIDRDQAALVRALAEARLQIARLEERLSVLEERSDTPSGPDPDPGGR